MKNIISISVFTILLAVGGYLCTDAIAQNIHNKDAINKTLSDVTGSDAIGDKAASLGYARIGGGLGAVLGFGLGCYLVGRRGKKKKKKA